VHHSTTDDTDAVNNYAVDMIQSLTDAFCASIPSHLGNKTAPVAPDRLDGVEFPRLPAWDENGLEEHYRLAAARGGLYVLHPIRHILKATAPTLKDIELGYPPLLREGQTEWIQAQLERVKKIYLLRVPSPAST
jgi:hypothetical protein